MFDDMYYSRLTVVQFEANEIALSSVSSVIEG